MDLSHGDGSVHVGLVGREAELLANLLDRPKAAFPIVVNGDGEQPLGAAPPFGGVQLSLAFERFATPTAQLGFPNAPVEVAVPDHVLVAVGDIFFRAGNE